MSSFDDTYYSISISSSGFDFQTTSPIVLISSAISSQTNASFDAYGSLYVSPLILSNSSVVSDALIVELVSVSISPNSSITVDLFDINYISTSISTVSDVVSDFLNINIISSSISVISSIASDAIAIWIASSSIIVNTSVSENIYIINAASSSILSNSIANFSTLVIHNISTGISISPLVTISSFALIINLTSSISITPNFVVSATTSQFLAITPTIFSNTNVLISSIDVLSSGIIEDTGDIKAFFIIDDIPITEHNRNTTFNSVPKNVVNIRSNGNKGVYFKTSKSKRDFTFEWSYLPGKRQNTVDLNAGRDFLTKIGSDQKSHTLKIRKLDTNGLTIHTEDSYTVLVTNYSESLIRRDLNNDEYYWNCSLSLQEV